MSEKLWFLPIDTYSGIQDVEMSNLRIIITDCGERGWVGDFLINGCADFGSTFNADTKEGIIATAQSILDEVEEKGYYLMSQLPGGEMSALIKVKLGYAVIIIPLEYADSILTHMVRNIMVGDH